MSVYIIRSLLVLFIMIICSSNSLAQSAITKVNIIAYSGVENTYFIDELKCMLENIFLVDVTLQAGHYMDISSAYENRRNQYMPVNY